MHNVKICYSVDDSDYELLRASVWSVRRALGDSIDIYVITDSYRSPQIRDCHIINSARYLSDVGIFPYGWARDIPFSSIKKLLIPVIDDFIDAEFVIFLDVNTLAVSLNLKKALDDLEVSDHEVMAVCELFNRNKQLIDNEVDDETREYFRAYWNRDNVRNRAYVNSGVLVFNLNKIRRSGIKNYKRRLELFWRGELNGKYRYLDQDFVNIMMDVDTTLPCCFNNVKSSISDDQLIRHFYGYDSITRKTMLDEAALFGYTKHAAACKDIVKYPVDLSDSRQLIMYLCHIINEESLWRYRKLKSDLAGTNIDVLWVLVSDTHVPGDFPDDISCDCYRNDDINYTPQFTCKNNPVFDRGASVAQWAVMTTICKHPGYDYYWDMEYDVCYSGDWKTFFSVVNKYPHDLICEHLVSHEDDTRWVWWGKSVVFRYPYSKSYKSLDCLSRISSRLYNILYSLYMEDNKQGLIYNENLWATAAVNECSCLDIGDMCCQSFTCNPVNVSRDVTRIDKLYHSIKLDVIWGNILNSKFKLDNKL